MYTDYAKNDIYTSEKEENMLHDYAHCRDYTNNCPEDCFRAQLVMDLHKDPPMKNVPVSWQSFVGLPDCPLPETEKQKKKGDFS